MGLGGVSIWQLLIIFVIVILIFGTSRLKSIGGDLGAAIKGFRKAMESDADGQRSSSEQSGERMRLASDGESGVDVPDRSGAEKGA